MSHNVPAYVKAPMTNRNAEKLAVWYGYESVDDFAFALPLDAQVADVGAGRSDFGHKVCRLRGDVSWTNIDWRYDNRRITRRLCKDAPPNLSFLSVNVLNLSDMIGESRFDEVFSYWLMPHLILESRQAGIIAANNMLKIVKSGGRLAVGPRVSEDDDFRSTMIFQLTGREEEVPKIADYLADASTLSAETKARIIDHPTIFPFLRAIPRVNPEHFSQ